MGNCSLRAVTDAAQGQDSARITSTRTLDILQVNGEGEQRQERADRMLSTSQFAGKTSVEVLPRPGHGVWQVKLAIDPKDLEQILSEQVSTEALIEQMRIAANATPRRGKSPKSGLNGTHFSQMCAQMSGC